jgi:hypothetical protein
MSTPRCPHCKFSMDNPTSIPEMKAKKPNEGSVTMCPNCLVLLEYGKDAASLHIMTGRQIFALPDSLVQLLIAIARGHQLQTLKGEILNATKRKTRHG